MEKYKRIKKWKMANKEKIRAYNREYHKKHRKKVNQWHLKHYYSHKEDFQRRQKIFRDTPKGKYISYKRSASKRKIPWDIDYSYFIRFWQKSCSYCGVSIKTIGIDRVNNRKGYIRGNLIPCCSLCNRMKEKMTKTKFIKHCYRIFQKYSEKKNT